MRSVVAFSKFNVFTDPPHYRHHHQSAPQLPQVLINGLRCTGGLGPVGGYNDDDLDDDMYRDDDGLAYPHCSWVMPPQPALTSPIATGGNQCPRRPHHPHHPHFHARSQSPHELACNQRTHSLTTTSHLLPPGGPARLLRVLHHRLLELRRRVVRDSTERGEHDDDRGCGVAADRPGCLHAANHGLLHGDLPRHRSDTSGWRIYARCL
jgi:hypothetical protein